MARLQAEQQRILSGTTDPSGSDQGHGGREFDDQGRGGRSRRRGDDQGLDADPEAVARSIVLRRLTAQARTRAELAKSLRARDVPDEAASTVLDRMEEVGLVDDGAFAEAWVESRQARRYLSRTALRQELRRKGVAKEQVDEALDRVTPEEEHAAAVALAGKRLRAMSGVDPMVARRRVAGALARRGFQPGTISRVLDEVFAGR